MGTGGSLLETIVMIPVVFAIFGAAFRYPLFQFAALVMWSGWWRLAAVPPLLVMVPITVQMVNAFQADANLAPLVFILTAPMAAAWLGIFALMRRRFTT
jgi:hypothetical protein